MPWSGYFVSIAPIQVVDEARGQTTPKALARRPAGHDGRRGSHRCSGGGLVRRQAVHSGRSTAAAAGAGRGGGRSGRAGTGLSEGSDGAGAWRVCGGRDDQRRGHGRFWYGPNRVVIAHRFALALTWGMEVLAGVSVVGRRCDNPLCQRVGPGHVVASTPAQTSRRPCCGDPVVVTRSW